MQNNPNMEKINPKKRLFILFAVISLLLVFSLIYAVVIMIQNGKDYSKKAMAQSTGSAVTILAKPGEILDTNGNTLASVTRVYRLILDPKVLKETEDDFPGSVDITVSTVCEAFGIDEQALRNAFSENETLSYYRYKDIGILSEAQKAKFEELQEAFQAEKTAHNKEITDGKKEGARITAKIAGVWFEEEYRRSYPMGTAFSKIIGYTTTDATEGLLGLENSYNSVLHGTNGKRYNYIDESGKAQTAVESAVNGYNLETSLDYNVSRIVQKAIAKFEEETGAERVNVLVMNPNNGEIYCMESDTEYDLNDPQNVRALFTEEEWQDPTQTFLLQEAFRGHMDVLEEMTLEDQQQALIQQVQRNYAVSSTYEPGSTAKTLNLAGAFEEQAVSRDETFFCDGAIKVSYYNIHCHQDTLCGDLKPIEALGRSCNVCFVQIAERMGAETFAKYQEIFNLGQKTGIDLPGEANTKNLIYYKDRLGEAELATCAFGQGFNVSMVQMASAYSSIYNGGYYYKPHIVRRITDDEGNIIREYEPELVRRTISEETAEYMKECLRYVTVKGTATIASTFGYFMGGKTGAAEKLPRGTGKYITSFIGAAPVEDAKFLVYAVVDEPHTEDQSMSAPAQELAHDVFTGLYEYFGVYSATEDDPYEFNWDDLKDSSHDHEAAHGESFIDDPYGLFDWIEDHETLENTENDLELQ